MTHAMMRAVVGGAVAAVVLVALAAVLALTGVLPIDLAPEPPKKLLVIAAAPDEEGADVAAFAFVLERGMDSATLLDTRAAVTVPGTTAKSARSALPFGGGEAVAKALSSQTGGTLPWLVLTPDDWAEFIDRAGGIEVDLKKSVSSYQGGELFVLEPGKRRMKGDEVVAVASALEFLDDSAKTERSISAGLSAVTAMQVEHLPSAVGGRENSSSLTEQELEGFVSNE